LIVRNRVKVFKMPAIVAKLHISSQCTTGVSNTQTACGP